MIIKELRAHGSEGLVLKKIIGKSFFKDDRKYDIYHRGGKFKKRSKKSADIKRAKLVTVTPLNRSKYCKNFG